MDIAARIQDWSGDGLYYHRIKPAAVRRRSPRSPSRSCSWTPIPSSGPAFMPRSKRQKMAGRPVVMNRFEKHNPYPPLKGFRTQLPHLGAYRYDVAHSWMFNSGLIGVAPAHIPLLDDTLAMIDALIGRAKKFPTIEQFARQRSAAAEPDRRSPKCTTPSCITGRDAGASIWPTDRQRRCRRIGTISPHPNNGRT